MATLLRRLSMSRARCRRASEDNVPEASTAALERTAANRHERGRDRPVEAVVMVGHHVASMMDLYELAAASCWRPVAMTGRLDSALRLLAARGSLTEY